MVRKVILRLLNRTAGPAIFTDKPSLHFCFTETLIKFGIVL